MEACSIYTLKWKNQDVELNVYYNYNYYLV